MLCEVNGGSVTAPVLSRMLTFQVYTETLLDHLDPADFLLPQANVGLPLLVCGFGQELPVALEPSGIENSTFDRFLDSAPGLRVVDAIRVAAPSPQLRLVEDRNLPSGPTRASR